MFRKLVLAPFLEMFIFYLNACLRYIYRFQNDFLDGLSNVCERDFQVIFVSCDEMKHFDLMVLLCLRFDLDSWRYCYNLKAGSRFVTE